MSQEIKKKVKRSIHKKTILEPLPEESSPSPSPPIVSPSPPPPIDVSIVKLPLDEEMLNILDNETSEDLKPKIKKYLESMNETERIAIKIAFNHLKTSFSIINSNGFSDFLKQ